MDPQSIHQRAGQAADSIRARLPFGLRRPSLAIICGSGLQGLQDTVDRASPRVEIPYNEIPYFPKPTVQGHEGKMVFGGIGREPSAIPVALLVGRTHFYEGQSMHNVTFAVRVCKSLGCKDVFVTNAAGGLSPKYKVGDIVMLHDHLSLPGLIGSHPLLGPNEEELGVRFPPMSDAYDLVLRRQAHRVWKELGFLEERGPLREGVYAFVTGPSYETRAEARMLHILGADLVGMSTVPEIVVARHAGMRVLALSLVTNTVVQEVGLHGDDEKVQSMTELQLRQYLSEGKANHTEVLEAGVKAANMMQSLVRNIILHLKDV